MFYVILSCIVIIILAQRTYFYKNLSERDEFTGCYNKGWAVQRKNSKLVRRMRSTHQTGNSFGLLFIDMDNFKELNDTKGHLAGDKVIKATVRAIQLCLSKKDVLVRFGGDEFMVITDSIDDLEELTAGATSILNKVSEVTNRTVSIGGAIYSKTAPINVEQIIGAADTAVYVAKTHGKNCVYMYV